MKQIKLLLVDDDRIICDCLKFLLGAEPDIDIIGSTDNRAAALRMVSDGSPDVVLMDVGLAVDDGIVLAAEMRHDFPRMRIVVFSALDHRRAEAESLGFKFLLKGCSLEELLAAVRGDKGLATRD